MGNASSPLTTLNSPINVDTIQKLHVTINFLTRIQQRTSMYIKEHETTC